MYVEEPRICSHRISNKWKIGNSVSIHDTWHDTNMFMFPFAVRYMYVNEPWVCSHRIFTMRERICSHTACRWKRRRCARDRETSSSWPCLSATPNLLPSGLRCSFPTATAIGLAARNVLLCVALCCNMLQCVAGLQYVAVLQCGCQWCQMCCRAVWDAAVRHWWPWVWLHAVCCSALQYDTVCCSVSSSGAKSVADNALQHTTT